MKDEVRRIMQLVKEGKLTPEDAAELIEAFNDAPDEEEPVEVEEVTGEEGGSASEDSEDSDSEDGAAAGEEGEEKAKDQSHDDPFSKLIGSIEKLTKDVATNVDWQDVSRQVREGVGKGVEAIKKAAEDASKGKGPFGSVFGVQERKRVELPLAIPEGKVFRIDAKAGDIHIEGGHDLGVVIVDAAFKAYNEEEAKKMADIFVPVLEENDDEVVLRQPDPSGVTADITVRIPKGIAVRIKNSSGDIKVSKTGASLKVKNESGDIYASDVTGMLTVETTSGDTLVENSDVRTAELTSKSGDLRLVGVSGGLVLKTASGNVSAKDCSARTVAAEAASGDLHLDMNTPVEGSYNLRTVSGDISLDIPDGSDVRVNLSTLRGNVACTFDLQDETRERSKILGKLGDGSGFIDASAVNGDVRLSLRDSMKDDECD